MKMKTNKLFYTVALFSALLIVSCNDDEVGVTPKVTLSNPAINSTGNARNTTITVQFSEEMEPSTITNKTFKLNRGTRALTGTVLYSGLAATFTPTEALSALTPYTVTVTTGARNLKGFPVAIKMMWDFTTGGNRPTLLPVNLGESSKYVILAKTAINNISTSDIVGNLGLSPAATSYLTGFSVTNSNGYATSAQVTGRIYAADMAVPTPVNLTAAISNMMTAYTDAAERPSPDFTELAAGDIGGRTLTPGVHKWTNTVTIRHDITIAGGPDDIWIFQIAENLSVGPGVTVLLSDGARAKNIFWQVAGEATLGTSVHVEGTILSMTGITLQTGASISGRALAQTAVILDANAISNPEKN